MKGKKIFCGLMIILLLAGCLSGCASRAESKPAEQRLRVTLITTQEHYEDPMIREMAVAALKKAQTDFDLILEFWRPKTANAVIESVLQATKNNSDLIIVPALTDLGRLKQIAANHPDNLYAVIGSDKDLGPNVMSLSLKEEEGAFMTGVIAGLTTQTGVIGLVDRTADAGTKRADIGFRAGVKAVRPETQIYTRYIKSYDNVALGKMIALELIDEKNTDIIFQNAGSSGLGVIAAAGERDIWVIGSNLDQSSLDPEHVLCSMHKKIDDAVYFAVQSMVKNRFKGGVRSFGLDFMAVGYSDGADNVPKEMVSIADAFGVAIALGDLVIPQTKAQLEEFSIPADGWSFLPRLKPDIAVNKAADGPTLEPVRPGN